MKLFFAYLRQRWKVLLGAVLFYALFAVSFALYGLPLAAVWYPAVLTAVLGLMLILLPMTASRVVFSLCGVAILAVGGGMLAERIWEKRNWEDDDPNIIDAL